MEDKIVRLEKEKEAKKGDGKYRKDKLCKKYFESIHSGKHHDFEHCKQGIHSGINIDMITLDDKIKNMNKARDDYNYKI